MATDDKDLGRFRPYLLVLARLSLGQWLQAKLDPSDIVQQTLLIAHASIDQFNGTNSKELAGWLRQILANVVAEQQRHYHRDRRDASREQSIERSLTESSQRLDCFATGDPTPSQQVEFSERTLQVAAAIESLPDSQRDVLFLHYWQGLSVPEIAELMDSTTSAISGLVHRGLKSLRSELANLG